MVINDEKKFVFVHVPKSAGTSIMLSLQSLPGNNVRWLAKTKHETLYELHTNVQQRLSAAENLSHRTPIGYFSFCFVRNPWDRMSSLYRYLCEKRPRAEIETISSFKDFLIKAREGTEWICGLHSMRPQVDYFYFPDRKSPIDFIGHFEYLENDTNLISKRIAHPILLSRENKSSNSTTDYRHDYDNEMVEVVESIFSDDCLQFGYEFEKRYPGRRYSGASKE
jgi:hypothetical protein